MENQKDAIEKTAKGRQMNVSIEIKRVPLPPERELAWAASLLSLLGFGTGKAVDGAQRETIDCDPIN